MVGLFALASLGFHPFSVGGVENNFLSTTHRLSQGTVLDRKFLSVIKFDFLSRCSGRKLNE